jgi:hypothetical protein
MDSLEEVLNKLELSDSKEEANEESFGAFFKKVAAIATGGGNVDEIGQSAPISTRNSTFA